MWVATALLAAVLLRGARAQVDTSVCNPGSYVAAAAATATAKPVPPLPKSFYANVEANIIDKGYTVDSIEIVDEVNDMVKIREEANAKGVGSATFTELFDFKNNQVVTIAEIENQTTGCSVRDSSDSGDRYLFGEQAPDSSGNQFFTSQGAWFLSNKFPAIYKGSATIRGIPADVWENCIYMASAQVTVKANWYFSATTGWNTATGALQVPLRLTIAGTIFDQTLNPPAVRPISHNYEFVHFRPTLYDDELIKSPQLPPNTVCPGLKSSKKMPAVPDSFSFTAELFIPTFNRITTVREFYDSKMMLGRYDYNQDFTSDQISEVHDWTTGIAYVNNWVYGNCTAQAIGAGSFDAAGAGNGKVKMRTSQEFFGLTNADYQYSGRRLIRNIPCDVFTALRNDTDSGLLMWEIAFTADDMQITGGPVSLEKNEPAFISLRAPEEDVFLQTYNIIDFDESQPDLQRFQIGNCYTEDQKTAMKFKLKGSYIDIVEKNRRLFGYMTLLSLIGFTAASPVRFSELDVSGPNDEIVVTFKLLDPPPTEVSNLCDDCPRRKANIPTADIIALLRDAIDADTFTVKADVDNVNNLLTVKAVTGSLVVGREDLVKTVQMQDISLDGGAAAGVAIGLFVTGVVITLLTLFLLVKFRGSKLPTVVKGFVPQTFGSEAR